MVRSWVPLQRDLGVDSRTASRSSFLVQTKMGPAKSSGTESPLFTRRSSPEPMPCRALPTLPPPTITAGATWVAIADEALTLNLNLNLNLIGGVGFEGERRREEVVAETDAVAMVVLRSHWCVLCLFLLSGFCCLY